MNKEELKQFEKDNRRVNRLLLEEYRPNIQRCLKCGQLYDSGQNEQHSRAAYYCGICLIEVTNARVT